MTAEPSSDAFLRTEDLTVRFGGLTALNQVNFAVGREEIRAIINHGYQTAKGILLAQRTKMDAIVEQLKIVETLDARELDEIIAREQPQAPAASSSAS